MILVVDDEWHNLEALKLTLSNQGHEVAVCSNPLEALDLIKKEPIEVVLTDFKMVEMSGLELLAKIKNISPEIEVIVMTAYATVENAVEAMKQGASDFLTKPLRRPLVISTVQRAVDKFSTLKENQKLKAKQALLEPQLRLELVGKSLAVQKLRHLIHLASPTQANVFVTGESGVGKSLIAKLIHYDAAQELSRFVSINCASIPENLLESELFGYEPGAFTDAKNRKLGRVELADKGTFFLDEIGELSFPIQAKLLRVIQEGEFERLGSLKTQKVQVRWVAATNRNVTDLLQEKKMREDLYYRLNVLPIVVPPLRERMEDLEDLVEAAQRKLAARHHVEMIKLDEITFKKLRAYHWPGNIRELENTVEKMLILRTTQVEMFWNHDPNLPLLENSAVEPINNVGPSATTEPKIFQIPFGVNIDELTTHYMEMALEHFNGNKEKAAELMGVHVRTIYRKKLNRAVSSTLFEPEI